MKITSKDMKALKRCKRLRRALVVLFLQIRCRPSSYNERCREAFLAKAGLGICQNKLHYSNAIEQEQHASLTVPSGVPERHVSH